MCSLGATTRYGKQGATINMTTAVKPLIYRTVEGIEVPYGPISAKLIGMVSAKYPTDTAKPPTYKFVDVTEEVQELPHDEDSIESEDTSPEDKAAWDVYQAEKINLIRKHNDEITRACLLYGVKLPLPDDDAWLDPLRYLEIDIPDRDESPHDFLLFWLFTEILKTPYDIEELTNAIISGGRVLREMRAVAASTFPGSLVNGNRGDSSATNGEDTAEPEGMVA